tara:strand:+ start:158 stop:724 length:567 start_codon:yes stop_codon:yes gene_type:complete
MKIISGHLKNKRLILPVDRSTRPLKSIVRESIFNIIEHSKIFNCKIKGSNILDLFSGVGSFGLEFVSRGADKVIFCENYQPSIKILKKNILNLNCSKNTLIFENDIYRKNFFHNLPNKKFEIICLDPPFKEKRINEILKNINNEKLLNKNGIIILHRNRKTVDNFKDFFLIKKEKTYGLSKIIFGSFF